ncbi:RNA methyltransferase [Nitrospirota bacterium]
MSDWRDNVEFILVEPVVSGNIGASARALKNMGFSKLTLINPPETLTSEATWLAHNAMDVLDSARRFPTLGEAIADSALVVASSRRTGKDRGLILTPKQAAQRIAEVAEHNKVSILFGREHRGLFNEEVDECGILINIPTGTEQPSLNLGQAVMVIAYELGQFRLDDGSEASPELAEHEQRDEGFKKSMVILEQLGYTKEGRRTIGRSLRMAVKRFFNSVRISKQDLRKLDGILMRIQKRLGE